MSSISDFLGPKAIHAATMVNGHDLKCPCITYHASSDILKDKKCRIYFIRIKDELKDEIIKIGGSNDKKGIRGTIYNYINPDSTRRNRFAIYPRIIEALSQNKIIEFWALFLDRQEIDVILPHNKIEKMFLNFDFKELETKWIQKYKEIFGENPKWNIIENNERLDGTKKNSKKDTCCS